MFKSGGKPLILESIEIPLECGNKSETWFSVDGNLVAVVDWERPISEIETFLNSESIHSDVVSPTARLIWIPLLGGELYVLGCCEDIEHGRQIVRSLCESQADSNMNR